MIDNKYLAAFVAVLTGYGSWAATIATAQKPISVGRALVFDGVTVVDVEQGKLLPNERVVIVGNRIRAMGSASQVALPHGAQRVDARGQYLIPGLWDLHTHSLHFATNFFYPLFIANGVTGIRDAWSDVSLDTLRQWRREILEGKRVGPPRQILSGVAINEWESCQTSAFRFSPTATTLTDTHGHVCISVGDTATARRLVGLLKDAGADMLKMYTLSSKMYFFIAGEARRLGIPFGGHVSDIKPVEAAEHGASIVDHESEFTPEQCNGLADDRRDRCLQDVAERFRRNGTWVVPTFVWGDGQQSPAIRPLLEDLTPAFWAGTLPHGNWLHAPNDTALTHALRTASGPHADPRWGLPAMQRAGLPLLAGTDVWGAMVKSRLPGFAIHAELAAFVAGGLTPVQALQASTLNPAKLLQATDSLGTIAPGKLADLVLLDADPLADITNTTTVRAVVANGRYYDRATLDRMLTEARANVRTIPTATLAGEKRVLVLPTVEVQIDSALTADARYATLRDSVAARQWVDSMIGVLLAERAPKIPWVMPSAVRTLATTGQLRDPADYRHAWTFGQSMVTVSDSIRNDLRHLVAAAGGRVALVPVDVDLRPNEGRAGEVCANLRLQLVDGQKAQFLWRSFVPALGWGETPIGGCGATPVAALEAAFVAAFPRGRAP